MNGLGILKCTSGIEFEIYNIFILNSAPRESNPAINSQTKQKTIKKKTLYLKRE